MYDIKFTFDIFIENICKVMKNSDQVKEYNLEKEMDKFRLGLQTNIDNTERRDFVWDEFLNYFEDE